MILQTHIMSLNKTFRQVVLFSLFHFLLVRRANPVWLDPFCRNLELAAQADHEDDLPENLSEITDLWNSPARTHVSTTIHLAALTAQ